MPREHTISIPELPQEWREVQLYDERVVCLASINVRISSNVVDFKGYSYFTRFAKIAEMAEYEVFCIDLSQNEIPLECLEMVADRSLRSKRFQKGYYRGPYFGEPAFLLTRGSSFFVFGYNLEKILWPYFVKLILTIHAADSQILHLKAGAFVMPNGNATLVVGQSGSGKTVFLTQACARGARFLSNTHILVKDRMAHGVASAIRVRNDPCFAELIARQSLTSHLEIGEYLTSAESLFGEIAPHEAIIENIIICNFGHGSIPEFKAVCSQTAASFLEQFALGINAYGLRDDLLEYAQYKIERYSDLMATMHSQLTELCRDTRCFESTCDLLNPNVATRVFQTLWSS